LKINNFEFKAKVDGLVLYENKLLTLHPIFIGIDHQIDTYFNTAIGKLKLREGNIENALIQYHRENTADAKLSKVVLYEHAPNIALKNILALQLGIKVVVDKKRKIYFIDNVKFHFDEVENLGTFIEVEAIDTDNKIPIEQLKQQCDYYFSFLGLYKGQLIPFSYSDLLMQAR
jgi:adenylate cyclase, class 2